MGQENSVCIPRRAGVNIHEGQLLLSHYYTRYSTVTFVIQTQNLDVHKSEQPYKVAVTSAASGETRDGIRNCSSNRPEALSSDLVNIRVGAGRPFYHFGMWPNIAT